MDKNRKNNLKEQVHAFIVNWNKQWPIDYWWRKKYNVPFGSETHRKANFIQMYYEYYEEKILRKWYSQESADVESQELESSLYKTKQGKKMSKQEIDRDFDNIDLSRYNTVKGQNNNADG